MKTNKDEGERQVNAGSETGRGEQAQHMPEIDKEKDRKDESGKIIYREERS